MKRGLIHLCPWVKNPHRVHRPEAVPETAVEVPVRCLVPYRDPIPAMGHPRDMGSVPPADPVAVPALSGAAYLAR